MFCVEAGPFPAALAPSGGRCKVAASPPCRLNCRQHWLPQPAGMDGAEQGRRQLMYVSMAVVLQAVASGVGTGGFCEGLNRRPFPLVVRVGTLACPLACCLGASYLSSLPLSYPSLARCCYSTCTGCTWTMSCSAPVWVCMARPCFPDAVTSLPCTPLLYVPSPVHVGKHTQRPG